MVVKATFWLLLYMACSLSHILLICLCNTRHKVVIVTLSLVKVAVNSKQLAILDEISQ